MSKAYIDESSLTSIGDAIRSKLNVETTYLPRDMATAIESIDTNVADVFECYVVGQTEYAQGWLSLEDGGAALTPEASKLYVVVDGTHENEIYRWDGTSYAMVGGMDAPSEIEYGYLYQGVFYEDSQHATAMTGETGKLYIDYTENGVYRWSGTAYVPLSSQIDFATQSEAEAGADNTKAMTPLRVAQEIAAKTDTHLSASSSNPVKNYVIKQQLEERLLSYSVSTVESNPARFAHSVGEYIVVEGILYEVKSAISVGDSISSSNTDDVTLVGLIASSASPTVHYSDIQDRPPVESGDGYYSVEESGSTAYGQYSHAEGSDCTAHGNRSHVGGNACEAYGDSSFAHGYQVRAHTYYGEHDYFPKPQFVIGVYNRIDGEWDEEAESEVGLGTYAFIIGNGTYDDDRSNLFTVAWDGTVETNGKKMLTEQILSDMVAEVVESSTAEKSYAVGDYFIYEGQLYVVTTAVSSGDSLTSNSQTTTIMEEIVRLTSQP